MSWTEVQALGVKAATGAGVPPAQSLAFGAMLARHVADDGPQGALEQVLGAPDQIVSLAHRIETIVETSSVSGAPVEVTEPDTPSRALLISWLAALPCKVDLTVTGAQIRVVMSLKSPGTRTRPDRLTLRPSLLDQLNTLAAKTYVPDSAESRASGAGAGLMELD
ncbi:MAG: hypothetical protein AB3N17_16925 [Tateyamaria sp.]